MKQNKRLEIQLQIWDREEMKKLKTQTATQAFCKACKRGVELPHKCPIDGVEIKLVNPNRRGI